MKVEIACLFVLLLHAAYSQTTIRTFSASISISNDSAVVGILKGTLYYSAASNNLQISKRIDYALGPSEYILWKNGTGSSSNLRYLKCSSKCETETYKKSVEYFYLKGGETNAGTVTINGVSTTQYNRATSSSRDVRTLYLNPSNGFPVRAVFASGKQIDFFNVNSNSLPSDTFTISPSWNCPSPICNVQMDIMYVFDESKSITSESWVAMKQFAVDLTNSFNIGPNAVQIGIVFFTTGSRTILSMDNNKGNIIRQINSADQGMGWTCISCGLGLASTSFPATRAGQKVQKIVILMTDGESNMKTDEIPAKVQALKDLGAITFVIGVTDEINEDQLKSIASNIQGTQTYFYSPSYSTIGNLLTQGLVAQTCIDISVSPCGSTCKGFCSCGQTCMCPDTCNDTNACTDDMCIAPNNGYGCQYKTKSCDDNDPCTLDSCDPNNGCQNLPVASNFCDDGKKCTDDTCVSKVGCRNIKKVCDDGDPCTTDSCSDSTGACLKQSIPSCYCNTRPNCTVINACTNNKCNPATGNCTASAVICDDGNNCTRDYCDPNQGGCVYEPISCSDNNACTIDTCHPTFGCNHTALDPVTFDDFNNCTIDSCDATAGILHTPVSCVDGDACTEDNVCDSIAGCIFRTKDCGTALADNITTSCYIAQCNSSDVSGVGCYIAQTVGAKFDSCGVCFGKGLTCLSATTVGIGAGIIAAIVIGSVAVAGAIFAGSMGGVKYYQKFRTNLSNANNNPLYDDTQKGSGTNPFYQEGGDASIGLTPQ